MNDVEPPFYYYFIFLLIYLIIYLTIYLFLPTCVVSDSGFLFATA